MDKKLFNKLLAFKSPFLFVTVGALGPKTLWLEEYKLFGVYHWTFLVVLPNTLVINFRRENYVCWATVVAADKNTLITLMSQIVGELC